MARAAGVALEASLFIITSRKHNMHSSMLASKKTAVHDNTKHHDHTEYICWLW